MGSGKLKQLSVGSNLAPLWFRGGVGFICSGNFNPACGGNCYTATIESANWRFGALYKSSEVDCLEGALFGTPRRPSNIIDETSNLFREARQR